jgi:hypothetical protein
MSRKVLCRLKLKKEWEFKVIALWQNMFKTALQKPLLYIIFQLWGP